MVDYTSSQTGDWDAAATWGGGGFPGSGDTATIADTHVVTVKGAEACGNITVNAGGVYAMDATAGDATITVDGGSTFANSGTVRFTGNTTNSCIITSSDASKITCTGSDWDWDFGGSGSNVTAGLLDIQFDVTTGGSGVTIDIDGDMDLSDFIISLDDTVSCTTDNVAFDFDGANNQNFRVFGTLYLSATSGNEITFDKAVNIGAMIRFEDGGTAYINHCTFTHQNMSNSYCIQTTNNSTTNLYGGKSYHIENCTLAGSSTAPLLINPVASPILVNNTVFTGPDGGDYRDQDIDVDTGGKLCLNNCQFTTMGMESSNGYCISKNHGGGDSGDWYIWGVVTSTDAPTGFKGVDWSGDDVYLKRADRYDSWFDTVLTLNETATAGSILGVLSQNTKIFLGASANLTITTALTGTGCDWDDGTFTVSGCTITNCDNYGSGGIVATSATDGGGNTGGWSFPYPTLLLTAN